MPLFGAVIVANETWQRIDRDLRPRLVAAARQVGESLSEEIRQTDREVIAVMEGYGLQTHAVPAATRDQWVALIETGFARLVGRSLDKESYDMANAYLQRFRQGAF